MLPNSPLRELLYVYRQRRVGRSPASWKLYEITLRHFGRFLGWEATLADLTETTVAEFLAAFATDHAITTLRTTQSHLNTLWTFAAKRQWVGEWPDLLPVKVPARVPTAWSVAALEALLDTCSAVSGAVAGLPAGIYWRSLILALYDTGLRIGAIWSTRRCDVDRQERTIYVPAEHQKNNQDQVLRFSEQTAAAIEAIWQPTRQHLWPWDRSQRMKYYYFDRILQRAGLPHGRRDKFQRIRRTTATLGLEYGRAAGFDPSRQLGHSSPEITRRHYLAPTIEVQAADVLPRP